MTTRRCVDLDAGPEDIELRALRAVGRPRAQNSNISPAVAVPPANVQDEDHEPSGVGTVKAATTAVTARITSTAVCTGLAL